MPMLICVFLLMIFKVIELTSNVMCDHAEIVMCDRVVIVMYDVDNMYIYIYWACYV